MAPASIVTKSSYQEKSVRLTLLIKSDWIFNGPPHPLADNKTLATFEIWSALPHGCLNVCRPIYFPFLLASSRRSPGFLMQQSGNLANCQSIYKSPDIQHGKVRHESFTCFVGIANSAYVWSWRSCFMHYATELFRGRYLIFAKFLCHDRGTMRGEISAPAYEASRPWNANIDLMNVNEEIPGRPALFTTQSLEDWRRLLSRADIKAA